MLYRDASGKKQESKPGFQLSGKRFESLLYHNWDRLVDELGKSLVALQEKAKAMDIVPKYLYIHYLRTSVHNELPFFRLDFLDENKWNGNLECWEYWDASVVTDMLYVCMPIEVDRYAGDRGKKEAEIEHKRLACADALHGLMKQMIEAFLQNAIRQSAYDIGCDVCYGEYMGGVKKIRLG